MHRKRRFTSTIALIFLPSLIVLGCQSARPLTHQLEKEPICQESGTVESHTIEETSRGYGYSYFIYLPPCYETETEQTYPVLYLLPGRGSGPSSWFAAGAGEAAELMMHNGNVPPFLIVGTEEISSDPLAEVIFNDLLPHIENKYRIKRGRKYTAVAGGSLGSIGAYRLALQHPSQFSSVGIFGGGLIKGEEARVQAWLKSLPAEEQPHVFLNTGKQDPLMLERAEAMINLLDEGQISHSEVFTSGEHTYAYWVSNFPTYLEWLTEDWK